MLSKAAAERNALHRNPSRFMRNCGAACILLARICGVSDRHRAEAKFGKAF
jgi:hypothetical protein